MKKKILFMVIHMNIGGTEKALLNMIAHMPPEKYDITILMLEKYGGFLAAIPSTVRVEYVEDYAVWKKMLHHPPRTVIVDFVKKRELIRASTFALIYVWMKITRNRAVLFHYLLRNYPKSNTTYDIAVAYAGPMDFISYFIVQKMKAKKKLQWIHFDITKIGFDHQFVKKFYPFFQKICVVSEEAKEKFIAQFPVFRERIEVFHNLISPEEMDKKGNEKGGFKDDFAGVRILTVGRLSTEKGQDLAIKTAVKLVQEGHCFRWYCLGEGPERRMYERLIEQSQLEDTFFLLGADDNPYPYMKQCDIYVQPSRYEGYCMTLMEAKNFAIPIVATDVNGVKEQVINRKTAMIVSCNETALFQAIDELMSNPLLRQKFTRNLERERVETSSEQGELESVFS